MDLGQVAQIMRQLASEGDRRLELRSELIKAVGNRPNRTLIQAVLEIARNTLAQSVVDATTAQQSAIIEAHSKLVELTAKAPTYNFDNALLLGEIASLLASAGGASEPAHG